MNKTVLITGIDGFIGKNLGTFLIENGYYVIGIGRRNLVTSNTKNYFNEYHNIDLFHIHKHKNIFKNVDSIVHLSAITGHYRINKAPDLALQFNMQTLFNLAGIYIRTTAREFIYPSSGKVYGIPKYLPIDERHPADPKTFLGRYKYIGEGILEYFYSLSMKSFTIFRIFNVYGPCQKKHFLIPKMINQIKNKEMVSLSNINDKRDYIFIDDLLGAFKTVFKKNLGGFNVFNVGSGHSYSPSEVFNHIRKLLKRKITFKYNMDKECLRKNEAKEERADITLLQKIGWEPRFDICKGLELTLKSKNLL